MRSCGTCGAAIRRGSRRPPAYLSLPSDFSLGCFQISLSSLQGGCDVSRQRPLWSSVMSSRVAGSVPTCACSVLGHPRCAKNKRH